MNITAQYTEQGSIKATFDGGPEMSIPDNAGNRHRQMIAEWEAEGNTIAAYVAPDYVPRRTGSAREFRAIFNDTERAAIVALTLINAAIKDWHDDAMAGPVFIGHPKVEAGFSTLVALGHMTPARKIELLAWDFDVEHN